MEKWATNQFTNTHSLNDGKRGAQEVTTIFFLHSCVQTISMEPTELTKNHSGYLFACRVQG